MDERHCPNYRAVENNSFDLHPLLLVKWHGQSATQGSHKCGAPDFPINFVEKKATKFGKFVMDMRTPDNELNLFVSFRKENAHA